MPAGTAIPWWAFSPVAAALLVPALGGAHSGARPAPAHAAELAAIAVALARWCPALVRGRSRWFGAVMLAVAAWLSTQTAAFDSRAGMAVVAGCGAAQLLPWAEPGRAREAARRRWTAAGRTAAGLTALVTLTTGVVMWTGANQAQAGWFGPLVSHGDRHGRAVALTFDDGPNATTTLAVADILDAHHVKGTFFSVGKAVERRPDISRELLAGGHLLANHSFLHDTHRWLDPRYPELMRADRVFARRLGVCPAFFRPPHSQHTPFMARVAHQHGITLVGQDTETADWRLGDPSVVAAQILGRVRPGSIIDLHDGLDGDVSADRTVVVGALPLILRGLEEKGLVPVRLDALLGRPGYRPACAGAGATG